MDCLLPETLRPDAPVCSFEALVGRAEAIGTNRGAPGVIALYRWWIAANAGLGSNIHAAWFNLGVELGCAGDRGGAVHAYRQAAALAPHFAPAAINLGLCLERAGADEAALGTWAGACQDDESRVALLNNQARLLERTGRLAEAEAKLRASLRTSPAQPDVIQHWVHVRQKLCAWPVMDCLAAGIEAAVLEAHCGPLAVLALTDDIAAQTAVTGDWIARKTAPAPERLAPTSGYGHQRLRIGYLSSDFCRHAMSFLIAELFERHDRSRFEIYGYCSTLEDGSDIRQRVLAAFDHRRFIRDMTDEVAARLIRADEIDVLIDLNGLTQGARLQILRWRPAPVLATYLGFVGPVPLPELDYLFCDDFVVPPALAPLYQPAPLSIGGTYQANDGKRPVGAPTTRGAIGLPEDGFLFCCFSNHYKITQAMFGNWMRILLACPGSHLWLMDDNACSAANLRAQAAALGIDPSRLLFTSRVEPAAYMARLAVADLFLDTFPYNAGTVASDAIRMGLPIVTRTGDAFASRMAAGFLHAIGAEAGIALSDAAYVTAAVRLAHDPADYIGYKARFTRENWLRSIGDIGELARTLEDVLEGRKQSFFEKKDQKTFILVQADASGAPE